MSDGEPAYNRAFDALVTSEDDVEGLLAYAYYKRHKRSWLFDFRQNRGRDPTPDEERVFAEGACVPDQVARYRQQAQSALIAYATVYVAEAQPEIERAAITARMESAALRIEQSASMPSLLRTGAVSTLISTGVLIILAIGIRLLGIDLIDAVSTLSEQP